MRSLSIDIETFSSVDLKKCGVSAYTEASDFDILLLAYAYDDGPVEIVDFAVGQSLPSALLTSLYDSQVTKQAFNAYFEITCLNRWLQLRGHESLDVSQWQCTMVHTLYLGLPRGLKGIAEVLKLDVQKDKKGEALIEYFSVPCAPTKVNGGRVRNLPEHDPDKWEMFKEYCKTDVDVERAVKKRLSKYYEILPFEHELWVLDQKINQRGVAVDRQLIDNAIACDDQNTKKLLDKARRLSSLANPKSEKQIKQWLLEHEGLYVDSIAKDKRQEIIDDCKKQSSKEYLKVLGEMSKTSVNKYKAMNNTVSADGRIRGMFQFYGASRTGRWTGKHVQAHNLPKNKMRELEEARDFLKSGNFLALDILYVSASAVLSQLIRTAFVPKEGCKFVVSDFSAIEARVIAWLAREKWRLDVFNTHGKIYEASASQMFRVPLSEISKDSPLRQKGKVAELALGYQGGPGALKAMGALDMGLEESELQGLVDAWRNANPNIVALWKNFFTAAKQSIEQRTIVEANGIYFIYKYGNLYVKLPSSRLLCYAGAQISIGGMFGNAVISFRGVNQTKRTFEKMETYGGKLTENIIQAIARDCLAVAMMRLDKLGYQIVMHVHDEVIIETSVEDKNALDDINSVMSLPIDWAQGLPLRSEGFEAFYYKKD